MMEIQMPLAPVVHPKMILAAAVFFALCEKGWFQPAGKSGAFRLHPISARRAAFVAIW
jgi:hypothetical protein